MAIVNSCSRCSGSASASIGNTVEADALARRFKREPPFESVEAAAEAIEDPAASVGYDDCHLPDIDSGMACFNAEGRVCGALWSPATTRDAAEDIRVLGR